MRRMKNVYYFSEGMKMDNKKMVRVIISFSTFLILLMLELILKDADSCILLVIMLLFCMNVCYASLILSIFTYSCIIEPRKIIFHIKFKKIELDYNSFDGLILAFTANTSIFGRYTFWPRIKFIPFVSFFFVDKNDKIPDKLLQRKLDREYVTSKNVKQKYLRNAETIYQYSARMDGVEENIFREFKGDYYITNSVLEKYHDLIQSYITKYKIDAHRIHLIDDRNKTRKQQ